MKVDNPQAFRYIMQDEIYLLPGDKVTKPAALSVPEMPTLTADEPELAENPVAQTATVAQPQTVTIPTVPVIATPQITQPAVETPKPGFNYLGNNNKNF